MNILEQALKKRSACLILASQGWVMGKLKELGLLVAGWIFILVGIAGLLLPFLQGIIFIMIGLAILSSRSKTIQRFLKYLEERYPQQYDRVQALREKVKRWLKMH